MTGLFPIYLTDFNLYPLVKLHHYVSLTILKEMYFSLICPFLMYGATIRGQYLQNYSTSLNCITEKGNNNHSFFPV